MIEKTTVDGVETLFVRSAGPMRAGLTFRVGRADETLARSGITHLIEHLALFELNLADYHFNATTGPVTTDFHLQGSASDITAYLSGVCQALTNPPFARLEVEKEILRTEQNTRSGSVLQPFGLWRHGARGFGVLSYPEWGLTMLGPDELRAWIGQYFTKENAVLWVAGPELPAGLRLPLPSGTRHPVPAVTSALPSTPAYFFGDSTTVAVDAVAPRGPAVGVFTGVLERELFRALRQENGLSYTAAATYEPRGDGYSRILALADALPDRQQAVLGGFVDVVAKLRVGRIDPADLAAVVAKSEDSMEDPDVDALRLPGAAFNVLTGYPNRAIEELRAELRAVTLADVQRTAKDFAYSALLMVPCETVGPSWAGFEAAPTRSTTAVTGTAYPSLGKQDQSIIVGPEGATATVKHEVVATVRFDECAAMLAWPDGARHLIGYDSVALRIEPTLLPIKPDVISQIDAAVPASAQVRMPARDPAAIPKPDPAPDRVAPAPQPAPAPVLASTVRPRPSRSAVRAAIVLRAVALVLGIGAVFETAATILGPADHMTANAWAQDACLWVVTIVLATPSIVLAWRYRGRRP